MTRNRTRLLVFNGRKSFLYFILFMMPLLVYYAVYIYTSSMKMGFGDLYVDYWLYGVRRFDKRPLLYIISAVIDNFFYVYLLFYFVILVAYKNVLRRVLMSSRYEYFILFIVFLVPYGAVTFYSNILYNGVALSFVVLGLYSEKVIVRYVFFACGVLLHFKAVLLFVILFVLPYGIFVNQHKKYYWFYLISMFFCVFLVFKTNLLGLSNFLSLDEDALYGANYFVQGVRDDHFLRFKLFLFFIFAFYVVKYFGGGLISKAAKDILYSTNVAALVVLIIPDVPFVERFVQPQIQFSVIMLVASAYLYFIRVLLGRRSVAIGRTSNDVNGFYFNR